MNHFLRILVGKSQKNSGKIIVIWIILIVLMGFGALQVFSHTNFNINNGFSSSNTMAQNAQNEISKYFPSANLSTSGTSSSLIIVTQNISTNTVSGYTNLVKFQSDMTNYLKTTPNYTGTTSLENIQMQALTNYTSGMYQLQQGNGKFVNEVSLLETGENASSQVFITLEEVYAETMLNAVSHGENLSQAEKVAYSTTLNIIKSENNPVLETPQTYFLNNVSNYTNNTLNKLSLPNEVFQTVQHASVLIALNTSFNRELSTAESENSLLQFLSLADPTLEAQNLTNWISNYADSNINESLTIFKGEVGAGLNKTCVLVQSDNTTLRKLFSQTYNLSQPINSLQNTVLSIQLTANASMKEFNGNPLFFSNSNHVYPYIYQLYNYTTDQKSSSNSTLKNFTMNYLDSHSLIQMPIQPTSYLYHNFVGYDQSTSIFIFEFNGNYSIAVSNHLQYIANNYTSSVTGSKILIAGTQQMATQLASEITSGLVKALGAGILLSILIVGVFFRSLKAAFMPIFMFLVSTIVSLGIIGYLYTYILHSEVSFITPTLLLIFILGLSSDYTVYIMARYRQELRKKTEHPTVISSRWAGHAVFTSGLTVILSEVALWLANVPFFSNSGFANAIGVSVTLIVANTFLLSILHRYGRKIFKKSDNGEFHEGTHKTMDTVGKFSTDHKKLMITIFVLLALVGLTVYSETPSGMDILKLLPSSQAITAIEVVNNSFNGDFFDRGFIIVKLQAPLLSSSGKTNTAEMSQIYSIENQTANLKGISEVYGPGRPYGNYTGYDPTNIPSSEVQTYVSQSNSFISPVNSSYVEIAFQTYNFGWGNKAIQTVNSLYTTLSSNSGYGNSYTVDIGGTTESLSNALHTTTSSFSELLPILSITIFFILLIQLSSALTPIRLVLMVLAAVLIALSISYVIFHYLQGLPVVVFMPVFVFITLLAVGVDYDVFMITRVREEVLKGSTLNDAVMTSVRENGGVIMLLGTLLFVTFAALYFSAIPLIQEIGIGVGLGVLIDTFVSWPLFIPAIMMFLGRKNWWPSKMKNE